jgi:hypothetical protein
MRRELLVPVDHFCSTPCHPLTGILAGKHLCPSSPTSQGHPCNDFKSSKGVPVKFQSPPIQSCELQKYVRNCKKFRKIPNQFCWNPEVKFGYFYIASLSYMCVVFDVN